MRRFALLISTAAAAFALFGCGGETPSEGVPPPAGTPSATSQTFDAKAPEGDATHAPDGAEGGEKKEEAGQKDGETAKPATPKKVHIVMDTSLGTIEADLDGEKAPITVANFVSYIKKKHYDGTIFHRVIPGFMIQGGGFTKEMEEKPTDAPIKNEASNGLLNKRGTLSMARTSDPDSATSQFFLSVNDNDMLDPSPGSAGYAVFGKVTKGMEVADKIVHVKTTSHGPHDDVPVEPVIIKSIKIKE